MFPNENAEGCRSIRNHPVILRSLESGRSFLDPVDGRRCFFMGLLSFQRKCESSSQTSQVRASS